jgi:hypothetical protein
METINYFKTLVTSYQSAQRHNKKTRLFIGSVVHRKVGVVNMMKNMDSSNHIRLFDLPLKKNEKNLVKSLNAELNSICWHY